MRPRARRDGLLVQDLPDETIVYDRERSRAYCLNPTARLVWACCDGQSTVEEIGRRVSEALDTREGPELARLALERLRRARLIEDAPEPMPRRDAARRLALGLLLPAVTFILVPSPAQSATCSRRAGCCATRDDCCPGLSLTCQGPANVPPCTVAPRNKRCF